MLKNIITPIFLALMAAAALGSPAYAQTDDPGRRDTDGYAEEADPVRGRRRAARGEIQAVHKGAFTFDLQLRSGETITFAVDENTRYHGKVNGLTDLEPGMKAGVVAKPDSDGLPLALAVLAPHEHPNLARYAGKITAVDQVTLAFSLETLENGLVTITVGENTRYFGEAEGLDDLEAGQHALVGAHISEDGSLVAAAVGVRAKQRMKRFAGSITSVDVDAGTFELRTLKGKHQIFLVDADTQFRSEERDIDSLADLEPGMRAVVGAMFDEDQLSAKVVMIGHASGQQLDLRARGEILALGDQSFTIASRDGQQYVLQVNQDTRFLSRDGTIQIFDDLEVGMEILVGATQLDSGDFLAKVVARMPADRPA